MRAPQPSSRAAAPPAGLIARDLAHRLLAGVLIERRPLEQTLADLTERPQFAALEARDRAFARMLAATVLRRQGELEHVLAAFLARPLPKEGERVRAILLAGAAQLLCLGTPPHAVVDLAVAATRRERGGARLAGLVNAVLRRVAERGARLLENQNPVRLNIPAWMLERWVAFCGEDVGLRIAEASLREAPLDLTLKSRDATEAATWAQRLGGLLLSTGSIRLSGHGRIEDLPGYAEGAWWVQDAAAALVARAAGDVAGKTVADLCAAPGGKTAALAAAGAAVTAVDHSPRRLARLQENLRRLELDASAVVADAAHWEPQRTFDVVVVDAPCTATGTIRRHPDILRLRQPGDVLRLAEVQRALVDNAARLVRQGGRLVYATCSLEQEEGERQIAAFLLRQPQFARCAITVDEIGGDAAWITAEGEVRTLPCHLPMTPVELSGMDGFYIARLARHT